MEGKPIFCLQFSQLENFRDTYHLNETKSGDRYVQCFPSCPPNSFNTGPTVPCKTFCNSTIPVVLGCVGGGNEKVILSKILLIAEIRPIESTYSITAPSSRTQIYSKCRSKLGRGMYPAKRVNATQTKANTDELSGMETQAFEFALDERSICRGGSFEAPSSSTQYVLSVTVLLPTTTAAQLQSMANGSGDDFLAPVAYFESPTFQVLSNGETHVRKSRAKPKPRPHNDIGVSELIEEFNRLRKKARAAEHATLCKQLSELSTRSLFAEQRFQTSVRPDLVAEDVLDWSQQEAVSATCRRLWMNPRGDVVADPTAPLMQKLHASSVVEQAMMCIMRHNSLIEQSAPILVEVTPPTPTSETKSSDEGEGATINTTTTANNTNTDSFSATATTPDGLATKETAVTVDSNDLSRNSEDKVDKVTNDQPLCKLVPASKVEEKREEKADSEQHKKDEFNTITYLRDQFLRTQQSPSATMLDKQFFADMLHNATLSTLQLSPSIDPSSKNFAYTAEMKFFFSLLVDIKPCFRALAIPYLSSVNLPELPALTRCVDYLHRHNHWKFNGSEGINLVDPVKDATPTNVPKNAPLPHHPRQSPQQCMQQQLPDILATSMMVPNQQKAVANVVSTGSTSSSVPRTVAMTSSTVEPELLFADFISSEQDDSACRSHPGNLEQFQAIVDATIRSQGEQKNLAEESAGTIGTNTLHNSPGNISGNISTITATTLASLEMICLLADHVCSGEHEKALKLRNKARKARKALRKMAIDAVAIEQASIRASLSLFGPTPHSLISTSYSLAEATEAAKLSETLRNSSKSGEREICEKNAALSHRSEKPKLGSTAHIYSVVAAAALGSNSAQGKRAYLEDDTTNGDTCNTSFKKRAREAGNIDFNVFNRRTESEMEVVREAQDS